MFKSLVGEKFGLLTVSDRLENKKSGESVYLCTCDCGENVKCRSSSLRNGIKTSCGCDYLEKNDLSELPSFVTKYTYKKYLTSTKDIGTTFNRLTLISVCGLKNNAFAGEFLCECGNTVKKQISQVRLGIVKSCGCLQRENTANNKTHGLTTSEIYRRHASMKQRCNDITDPVYGGKGISYDPYWEDFMNFYNDMKEGFSPDLELDRIDVSKGYSKDNCRWTTRSENNYNKNVQNNNKSGKTGVCWHSQTGKYRAYITQHGKQTSLGLYDTLAAAIEARKNAEILVYGYNRP